MSRVNLVLIDSDEIDAKDRVRLVDRRARHLLDVLAVEPGQRIAAGVIDGPSGHGEVLTADDHSVSLQLHCAQPERAATDVLLLAVPRPRILARMFEHAAALGFGRIVLFRSWRVEKSHLASKLLQPTVQRQHLLRGLEQSRRTHVPSVEFHPLFRPFVEDRLDLLPLPDSRFCAHPRAPVSTADLHLTRGSSFALALGPDGGFVAYEVEQLAARGFLPVRFGPHPLRTESALSAAWGQLDLLRRRG
ncbi:MAG: RsmE family RNA methyltransferase [Planctomycetota bacterium]|nr:RsmE family RNA methyltransferase [Planctomycetota bacterium]